MKNPFFGTFFCAFTLAAANQANGQSAGDWPFYGYDSGSTRFSPLRQITPANVSQLKVAWTYDMRPAGVPKPDNKVLEAQSQATWIRRQGVTILPPGAPPAARGSGGSVDTAPSSAEEFTPIVVGNTMFFGTAFGEVVALDATTGKEKWTFRLPGNEPIVVGGSVRGFHYWPGDKGNKPRLVIVSTRLKLFTLDPQTGKINSTFGKGGVLDLRTADVMGNFPEGFLGGNAMPAMYQNIVIVGSRGQESPTDGPRGDVRGIDIITGKTLWKFNAIPEPGDQNFGTWKGDSWKNRAGVDTWNMITVDDKRGIAYLPFGAPAYDRDGSTRIGDGLYGNALVAIDAKTGTYLWHFQTIHHDVWDDDIPGTPTLLDVKRDGKTIPAVAAINKTAILFILNRITGKPLFDVVETPVPKGEVPGDITSPTQPIPVKPEQLARSSINLDTDISDITPEHEAWCKKWVADNNMVSTTRFSPLGFNKATVIFPGAGGGVNWGGGAFDKADGNYVVNITNQGSFEYMATTPDGRLVMATSPNSWFADVRDGGMQCQKGPWGELVAVNVSTGDISWRSTLGVTDWLPKEKQLTGRPSTGGPIVTAGGLVFIAATDDKRFRAFNAKTGKQLWETTLGASGHATPLTYLGKDGKQYVALIATGGSYIADPATSDNLVAYALQ
jgi:quinoprotein glucose dehydrogenase